MMSVALTARSGDNGLEDDGLGQGGCGRRGDDSGGNDSLNGDHPHDVSNTVSPCRYNHDAVVVLKSTKVTSCSLWKECLLSRETSNIYDGSAFTADMAVQNCIGDAFRGATWVSIHNGGGVGWGEVCSST